MTGEVEDIREKAVLDGYGPEKDDTSYLPRVERELLVRIQEVFLFCLAPPSNSTAASEKASDCFRQDVLN
jgi:hypothetical protein